MVFYYVLEHFSKYLPTYEKVTHAYASKYLFLFKNKYSGHPNKRAYPIKCAG